MQSTSRLIEEAKNKRTLASLKPIALPEKQIAGNVNTPDYQNNGNRHLPENQDLESLKVQHAQSYDLMQSTDNNKHDDYFKNQIPKNQINENISTKECQKDSNIELPEENKTRNKVKVTVYINEDSWDDFNKIYGIRIANKRKTDKGELMMEAIELLKKEESKIID